MSTADVALLCRRPPRGDDRLQRRRELDTINICVPTPLRKTKDPDMSYIVSAVEAIAAHLHPGMLVVLESTTYPGTTDEVVQPMLERSGLKAGVDFFLAFSPERVDPGNATFTHAQRAEGRRRHDADVQRAGARALPVAIDTVVPVSSPRVAEMVKLLENTFRAVNIGLVNEIALMCDTLGIDVWEVIDAAKTKPFGFMPFYPGPGLGGHCIPIDPFYLSWKAKQTGFEPRFIELAGHINASMPHYVVDKIGDALERPAQAAQRIARPDRRRRLQARHRRHARIAGARRAWDCSTSGARASRTSIRSCRRCAARAWQGGYELESVDARPAALADVDCVAILTDTASSTTALAAAAPLIVDTRNAIKSRVPHVFRLGAPRPPHAAAWAEAAAGAVGAI